MKTKLSKGQKKLFETFIFLIKLIVLSIPLYVLLFFSEVLMPLQNLVAYNVHFILKSVWAEVVMDGVLIKSGWFTFFISEDCTGWKSMLFLFALIFAVPRVQVKKRLMGLAAGIPAIYAGNLFRIVLVVFIWQAFGYETAMIMHDYFWQIGLVSLVLVVWILWLVWAGKIGGDNKKEGFLKLIRKCKCMLFRDST